jgi:hypothetical protein
MLNMLLLLAGAGSGAGDVVIDDPTTNRVVTLGRVIDLNRMNRVGTRPPGEIHFAARNPIVVQIELSTVDAYGELGPYSDAVLDVCISNSARGGPAHANLAAGISNRGNGTYIATIAGAKISDEVRQSVSTPFLVIHEASGLLVGIAIRVTEPKIGRLTV